MVNVLPNYRSGDMFGTAPGVPRRAIAPGPARRFSSCPICRRSTSRRGSTSPTAGASRRARMPLVRIEAVPGRDFKARIERISVLARVDFSSGWPPPRNFDLGLILLDVDPRIRPGMTRRRAHRDRARARRRARAVRVGLPARRLAGRLQARRSGFDERRVQIARSAARNRRSSRRASRPATASRPAVPRREIDQETPMKRRVTWASAIAPGRSRRRAPPCDRRAAAARARAAPCRRRASRKGPLKLTVHATGELRAGRTMTLVDAAGRRHAAHRSARCRPACRSRTATS